MRSSGLSYTDDLTVTDGAQVGFSSASLQVDWCFVNGLLDIGVPSEPKVYAMPLSACTVLSVNELRHGLTSQLARGSIGHNLPY